jgi:hypothetical protein
VDLNTPAGEMVEEKIRIINEKLCDNKRPANPADVERDKHVQDLWNAEMDQTALDYFFARYGDSDLRTMGGTPLLPLYRSIDDDWKSSQK